MKTTQFRQFCVDGRYLELDMINFEINDLSTRKNYKYDEESFWRAFIIFTTFHQCKKGVIYGV